MSTLRQLRDHAARYDRFAWGAAFAASALIIAAFVDWKTAAYSAEAIFVLAFSAWLGRKWVGTGAARSVAAAALIALWLWTLGVLWYLGTVIYPYPAANRAHAQLHGVELGPYLAAILAITIVISGCAVPAVRVLGSPGAADRIAARLACFLAPLCSIPLAFAPVTWLPAWKSEADVGWLEIWGFDQVPFLLYLKTGPWWGVLAAIAFALAALAWMRRRDARVFAGALASQIVLLAACGGLVSYAVLAGWLPFIPCMTE